jgi:hypothetical protein
MLSPVLQQSLTFVSDGTSQALTVDLSLIPFSLPLRGAGPLAILTPSVSSVLGPGPMVTAAIVGSTVTFTFAAALAELNAGALLVYTLQFIVAL